MTYTYKTTVAPLVEPVTREEVKAHAQGIDWPDDDALIDAYISTAREWMEDALNRALITQTIRATHDLPRVVSSPLGGPIAPPRHVSGGLALPRPPLLAVSLVEGETSVATWASIPSADYAVDTDDEPGRVYLGLAVLSLWSSTLVYAGARPRVRITYTAGYGSSAASVPYRIRQGIKEAAAWLYDHRGEGEIPRAFAPRDFRIPSAAFTD